jgi:hypothetical protein
MPECTICNQTHIRRKRGGLCPGCDNEVEEYDGRWYPAGTGSPSLSLLRHFEQAASKKLSQATGESVVWSIQKKGTLYKRELATAKRIIDRCDGQIHTAKEVLDYLFWHPNWSWKSYKSLLYIERDFDQALAVIRARQKRKEEEQKKTISIFSKLDKKEDIFND